MNTKLAQLLLRRKELNEKIARLGAVDMSSAFETKTGRGRIEEGFQDLIAEVPKISMQQFTHCYDWHAKQLRVVDALIQQTNWETAVEIEAEAMGDYVDPYVLDKITEEQKKAEEAKTKS